MDQDAGGWHVAVSTTEELRSVAAAYAEALRSGESGTLEVVLAAGQYAGESLQLADTRRAGTVDVVIRGDGGQAVFSDARISVQARSVVLRDLAIVDTEAVSPLLELRVAGSATLERLALVGNRTAPAQDGRLVRIVSSYRTGPADVAIRDSWFVDNHQQSPAQLLSLESMHPDTFGTVRVERVALVGNRFAVGLDPAFADELVLDSVLIVERPDTDAPFVTVRNPKTRVQCVGSTLRLAVPDVPVRFTVDDPAELTLEGCDIGGAGAPDELVAEARRLALKGQPPVLAELVGRLP